MATPERAHERRPLGFQKYSDSKVLSDVTIRYGASGELTFEAHKLLLSSKSYWFEAAFTGGFAESNAREITLKEDDPEALQGMLIYMYNNDMSLPDEVSASAKDIRYLISLYRVADKYDFPDLQSSVIWKFHTAMINWLGRSTTLASRNEGAVAEFCSIVSDIYNLVGPEPQPAHPLINFLLVVTGREDYNSILNNDGGNQRLLTRASQEVAEFGRDLFLHLMGKIEKVEKDDGTEWGLTKLKRLYIGTSVRCPMCGDVWTKVEDKNTEVYAHCPHCAAVISDWTEHEWF